MENEKQKKKKLKILDIIVVGGLSCIFLFSAWKLYGTMHEYQEAENEYVALQEYVTVNETEEVSVEVSEEQHEIPELLIDFDLLTDLNEDVIGWLYIPILDISYPVVQGEDNSYYLKRTFTGEVNSSGSIFMDWESNAELKDRNTFIYGHNMKNGSMFGSLKRFRKEEGLCAQNPNIFYYSKNADYQFQIFSYYLTTVGSPTYYTVYANKDYDEYIERVIRLSEYEKANEMDFADRANLLTLSTCSGMNSKYRLVVHAKLIDKRDK